MRSDKISDSFFNVGLRMRKKKNILQAIDEENKKWSELFYLFT